MKICPKCGKEIPDHDDVCGYCGLDIGMWSRKKLVYCETCYAVYSYTEIERRPICCPDCYGQLRPLPLSMEEWHGRSEEEKVSYRERLREQNITGRINGIARDVRLMLWVITALTVIMAAALIFGGLAWYSEHESRKAYTEEMFYDFLGE